MNYNYKESYIANANDDFTINNEEDIYNADVIREFVQRHKLEQLPRLQFLEDYYLNRNVDVLRPNRRAETDRNKADHRATHNYAKYISQFIVGYMTGNPITISHNDSNTQQVIMDLNDFNDADSVNSQLSLDLSIYGRAFEIVYRNEEDEDKFLPLNPKNTFCVYNTDIERKMVAGIRYSNSTDSDGKPLERIEVYTNTKVCYYELMDGNYRLTDEQEHYYGEPQITEYVNDGFKQGDYENVISLIDLYDSAQSDTANYMTDLNDAMLAIIGNVDLTGDEAIKFKNANMIKVTPGMTASGGEGKTDVKYVYKEYDVNGSEAYKTRLENDIHKFTNTPDLNDDNFAGAQSGESMKYKLFGLDQKRATKERFFKKGLIKRYRLLFRMHNIVGNGLDHTDITVTFTPNLPKAIKESVDVFTALQGSISEKTLLSQLPFIDNPDEEAEQMKLEREARQQELENARSDIYDLTKVGVDNAKEKQ